MDAYKLLGRALQLVGFGLMVHATYRLFKLLKS